MNMKSYLELCRVIEGEEKRVEEAKRPSYTAGNSNVLHNFVRDGELQGIDPLQNLLAHYLKQVAAIVSYVRNPDTPPSEPLLSRVVDARVYPKLLLALAVDQRGERVEGFSHKALEPVELPSTLKNAYTPLDIPWDDLADAMERQAERLGQKVPEGSGSTIRTNFPGYMS